MNANERKYLNDLAERVVGAAYEVANTLGPGFLEKVYERALIVELRVRGIKAVGQTPIEIYYKGEPIGEYFADILVEDSLLVELKCAESLSGPVPQLLAGNEASLSLAVQLSKTKN